MTIRFESATYVTSAPSISSCPPDEGLEIAFAGRSNAGKSSAINTLTNNSKLARTSKTPGRTQLINFFELSANHRIVDLPGYGFAKVPLPLKEKWKEMMTGYLEGRNSLKGLVVVMDSRHPLKEIDQQMIQWAAHNNIKTLALLTKSDKLSRNEEKNTFFKAQKAMKNIADTEVLMFSSLKKTGLTELKQTISHWLDEKEGP